MPAPRTYTRKKCTRRSFKAVDGRVQMQQCKAWAQPETDYCWVHNPDGRANKKIAATKQMECERR